MIKNKRFTIEEIEIDNYIIECADAKYVVVDNGVILDNIKVVELLNNFYEEKQSLKEEKELLRNKLNRIEDILPHFLSCAEISEFRSKTVKEDLALMECWNKRYQK